MGIFYALLSALFSASKDLLSKRLAFQIDGLTSTFASFAFALPFYVAFLGVLYFLGYGTFTLVSNFFLLVFLRSVTDVLAEGMKMYAFSYADISVAACFFSLSPLLLLITSPLITGDPMSWEGIVATVLVVGGSLLLVYRPSDRSWAEQKKGIMLALGASLFFALNTCFDRLAVREERPTIAYAVFTGFAMTLLSALFLVPMVAARADRRAGLVKYQRGLWLRGVLEVLFMSAKLVALQYMDGPLVVNLQRLSLVLSIVGGRIFFKEADFARRLAAGMLIFVGAIVILFWQQIVTWFGF